MPPEPAILAPEPEHSAPAEPETKKPEGEGEHRFIILKNYPESRHFEIVRKERSLLERVLGQLGLKKGNQG